MYRPYQPNPTISAMVSVIHLDYTLNADSMVNLICDEILKH